jgi:hypothetical protein
MFRNILKILMPGCFSHHGSLVEKRKTVFLPLNRNPSLREDGDDERDQREDGQDNLIFFNYLYFY